MRAVVAVVWLSLLVVFFGSSSSSSSSNHSNRYGGVAGGVGAAGVGGFRVNLKGSDLLSRLWKKGGGNGDKTKARDDDDAGDDSGNFRIEDILHVDFSGDLDVHLLGSSIGGDREKRASAGRTPLRSQQQQQQQSNGGGTLPLVRVLPPRGCWPGVFVGLHYDFSRCWYGATRLRTRLRWTPATAASAATGEDDGSRTENRILRIVTPVLMDVCGERQLLDAETLAGEVVVGWNFPRLGRRDDADNDDEEESRRRGSEATTFVKTRFDSAGQSTLSVSLPLHRRLQYECTIQQSRYSPSSSTKGATTADIDLLPEPTRSDEPWWLPDLTLGATGDMEARNQAVFPHPRRGKDGRVGLRLYAARRATARGGFDVEAEPATILSLELSDVSVGSVTGIRLETQLERPIESARLCVLQQLKRPSYDGPASSKESPAAQ